MASREKAERVSQSEQCAVAAGRALEYCSALVCLKGSSHPYKTADLRIPYLVPVSLDVGKMHAARCYSAQWWLLNASKQPGMPAFLHKKGNVAVRKALRLSLGMFV